MKYSTHWKYNNFRKQGTPAITNSEQTKKLTKQLIYSQMFLTNFKAQLGNKKILKHSQALKQLSDIWNWSTKQNLIQIVIANH